MIKHTFIAIATLLALQSGAAFADNNWTFDDAYWKSPARSGAMTSQMTGGDNAVNAQFSKYRQVDGYNY